MATVKRIVCLANSRKLSGRCVAGIEIREGQRLGWVRPISAREHEEVSERERQYEDGSDPRLLDVVDIPLLAPRPKRYQQENWLLDPARNWQRVSIKKWDDLHALADKEGRLWIDGDSTYNGQNDRISLARADTLQSSLRLLRVTRMTLFVFRPSEAFGNSTRRVQGRFAHAGVYYHFWVTDPVYEATYLARPDGAYQIGESFLTVSLGEPYNGACYKLIAAIMERCGGPGA